jgi:large subunit ribosomal protein L21
MYAIFEDGSRQYRVEVGSSVVLDYRDTAPGQTLELNKVLLLKSGSETLIGRPLVEGARVVAEVVELPRVKTITGKFRRRKNYRRLKGHTQPYVRVRVKHILKAGEPLPVEAPKPVETSAPAAVETASAAEASPAAPTAAAPTAAAPTSEAPPASPPPA